MAGFLEGLSSFLGPIGQSAGGLGAIGSMFGLGKDRQVLSNRDFQTLRGQQDQTNLDDIQRQNTFLAGVTPANASAYNTYQDATYGADTQRQIDRIKSTGDQLGMSPWEVTGASGAAPLPSPGGQGPTQAQSQGTNFLSAMVPLKTAEIQAKTQLQQTAMNNATQKEIAGLTTDTQKVVANIQTANGRVPITQADQNAAQTILTHATTKKTQQDTKTGEAVESLTWTQGAAAENKIVLDAITTLLQVLPRTEIDLGPYKTTEAHGYQNLLALGKKLGDASKVPEAVAEAIRTMPPAQWDDFSKEILQLATATTKAAKGGLGVLQDGANFLSGLFGQNETTTDSVEYDDQGNRKEKSSHASSRRRIRFK